jgi:lysophospholipase L1-like esterase
MFWRDNQRCNWLDSGLPGTRDRLKTEPLGAQQREYALTEAREDFIPGRILQATFVEQYQPKIITIGIGGNDVGFMDKLKSCLGIDTCEWALTPEGREKSAAEIQGLYWTLLDTYTNLRRFSPQSTIYAVGYPKIIDPNGSCGVPLGLMFNSIERRFMDEGIKLINQVIAAAAKKAGVHYIDIENSLGDQVLCGGGKPTAMNWIRLGDDSGVSSNFNFIKVIGYESFHPTPTGQDLISKVVAAAITNGTAADACAITDTHCYNSVRQPWPSEYWLLGGIMHDYVMQHDVKFTSDQIGSIDGKRKTINMPQGFFDASSKVNVELHSDPIDLGYLTTDSQGALSADISLPSDIPDGYHTIHLYGTTPTGEKVDYYDVINTTPVIDSHASVDVSGLALINPATSSTQTSSQNTVNTTIENSHISGSDSQAIQSSSKAVLGDSSSVNKPVNTVVNLRSLNLLFVALGIFTVAVAAVIIIKKIVRKCRAGPRA